jgi:undecaprenyl-diphosphatase
LEFWQAAVLGIVEGLTEYLPVSSTGHLILTSKLLGLPESEGLKSFEVVIQAGAILAVVGVYFNRIGLMIRGLFGKSPDGLRLVLRLGLAFAITSVLALLFEKRIKEHIFDNLTVISWAWIIGGILMIGVEVWRRRSNRPRIGLEKLSWVGAMGIGLFQAIALCPGVSRSLAALVGGLLVGLEMSSALEFSFLLGGLTLTAAAGYETVKHFEAMRTTIPPGPALVGILAATIAAWLTVTWMLRFLNRVGLTPFAVYRVGLGLVVLTLIWTGRLVKSPSPPSLGPAPRAKMFASIAKSAYNSRCTWEGKGGTYAMASALANSASQVLRDSPRPQLRSIDVVEDEDEVVLNGRVDSYFEKQLAQETVLPVLGPRRLRNLVIVSRA